MGVGDQDVAERSRSGDVTVDTTAPGCPVVSGNFSFGGERGALDGFAIYDEINRAGPIVRVEEGVGYYLLTDRAEVAAAMTDTDVFSNDYNANLRVGGIGAAYPMKPLNVVPDCLSSSGAVP